MPYLVVKDADAFIEFIKTVLAPTKSFASIRLTDR
jgi:hypothetical protein